MNRDVAALGMARAADAVANSFLVIVLPLYVASPDAGGAAFGLDEAAVTGMILAVFGVSNAPTQPFAGRLSDRVGLRKPFVLAGLAALTVVNALFVLADSYAFLVLLRIGQGMAVAVTVTASVALVNELSTSSDRGNNMGTYNSFRLVGFGAGPLAAGFVVSSGPYALPGGLELSGFDAAFAVAAAGAALSGVLVALMVREPEGPKEPVGAFRIAVRDREGPGFLDPIFALGVATLVMAACIALLAAIEPRVNARLGQGPRWFGVQFAVFILTLAAAQPVVGRLSDRFGRKAFVVWGLLSLFPTTLAQGLVTTPVQMVVARLAQGISGALIFAPALALAGDLARKEDAGLKLSVLTMAFVLGLSAGQLLSGFLVVWGFAVPFAVGGTLALAAAAVVQREVQEPSR